jgi:hypothetical protein
MDGWIKAPGYIAKKDHGTRTSVGILPAFESMHGVNEVCYPMVCHILLLFFRREVPLILSSPRSYYSTALEISYIYTRWMPVIFQ